MAYDRSDHGWLLSDFRAVMAVAHGILLTTMRKRNAAAPH
jgi:hypothetical protein